MKTYEMFKEEIKERVFHILSQTGEVERIELDSVLKNNNQNLDVLRIFCNGSHITPNIYLNDYFRDYQDGETLDDIAQQIVFTYQKNKDINFEIPNFSDFSCLKNSIFPKIINYEQNKEFLKDKPYTLVQDMAVIYQIKIYEDNVHTKSNDIGVVIISNKLVDIWQKESQYLDISKTLHSISLENMKEQNPPNIKSMIEVFVKDFGLTLDEIAKQYGMDIDKLQSEPQQYVLTNQNKINGATVILDNDFMQEVAEKIGGDFYIIPSSIHELIAQPIEGNQMSIEEINDMIKQVNATQVAIEEVLSNNAYAYDSINKEIYIAGQDRISELKKEFSLPSKGAPAKKAQQTERKVACAR